jgi:hypothetical protein
MDLRAVLLGSAHMRDDRALAGDQPAALLEDRTMRGRQAIARPARIDLVAGQHLMGQIVQARRIQRALEERIVLGAGVDRAGDDEQFLARRRFDLTPELVGAPEQRHIGRILVVGHADDPADAVGRTHVVWDVEAFEAENLQAAPGHMPGSGASHASDPDDDHVIGHSRHIPSRCLRC